MATYTRQNTIQSQNTTQTQTKEPLQSMDIGSIIIKSFETVSKEMKDNEAIPVKITEDKTSENDDLLKDKTKVDTIGDLRKLLIDNQSRTLNRNTSIDSKNESSKNKSDDKSKTSDRLLTAKLISNSTKSVNKEKDNDKQRKKINPLKPLGTVITKSNSAVQKGIKDTNKHLSDLKNLTLLGLISNIAPKLATATATMGLLPSAVEKITEILMKIPIWQDSLLAWLKSALVGPDNVFVKFGRVLRKGVNDIGAKMAKSDNKIIAGLGSAIFGASGGSKHLKMTKEMEADLRSDNPEMVRFINQLESSGINIRDKEGNLDFNIDEAREAYKKVQEDTLGSGVRGEQKRFGEYFRTDVMGNTAVTEYLQNHNYRGFEDPYALSLAVDELGSTKGIGNAKSSFRDVGRYATTEKQLDDAYNRYIHQALGIDNSVDISKMDQDKLAALIDKSNSSFLDTFAKYEMVDDGFGGKKQGKFLGFDMNSAIEAMKVYGGAQFGKEKNDALEKNIEKNMKGFDDIMDMGSSFGLVENEAYDPETERKAIQPKIDEWNARQLLSEVQKHSNKGDYSSTQWKEWMDTANSRYGEGMGEAALLAWQQSGNTLGTKDHSILEELNRSAHERAQENKKVFQNVINSVVGVTTSQSTSAVSNQGN